MIGLCLTPKQLVPDLAIFVLMHVTTTVRDWNEQLLKLNKQTSVERNKQVIAAVLKNKLKILLEKPVAGVYSARALYIRIFRVEHSRLAWEEERVQ